MNHCNNSGLGNLWTLSSSRVDAVILKKKSSEFPLQRDDCSAHSLLSLVPPGDILSCCAIFLICHQKPQGCFTSLHVGPLSPWWGLHSCWPWKVHQSNEAGCESMYMGVWDGEEGLIELRDGVFPPAGAVKQQVDAIIRAGRWSKDLFTAGLALAPARSAAQSSIQNGRRGDAHGGGGWADKSHQAHEAPRPPLGRFTSQRRVCVLVLTLFRSF